MRFLEHLQQRWMNGNARFWGKECVRVMFFAYVVKSKQYERTAPSVALIIRQTVLTRSDWGQVSDNTLVHRPTGTTIEMGEDTTLNFAIHAVIQIEYLAELSKLMPSSEAERLVREAHNAADEFIAKKYGPK
jgi:hypothetical protein